MRFKGVRLLDRADQPAPAQAQLTAESAQAVYRIENMDCPTEEALIRSKLAALPGVVGLDFNLMQRTLAVRHELPSLTPVEQALKAIGMQAVRMDKASDEQTTKLVIAKMDCPTEEALIRNKLATVAGVTNLDFNLMQRTLSVRHAAHTLPEVLAALKSLNFEAQVLNAEEANASPAISTVASTNWGRLASPWRLHWLRKPSTGSTTATIGQSLFWRSSRSSRAAFPPTRRAGLRSRTATST